MKTHPIYDALSELTTYPGVDNMDTNMLYLMGCSNLDQFCATLRGLIDPEKHCPFCVAQMEKRKIINQTERWCLIHNDFPKKGSTMLLIVPKRHLVDEDAVDDQDAIEIRVLKKLSRRGLPGGVEVWRFGNPLYHAGTVPHSHINIISPNPLEENRVPISKTDEDRRRNFTRLLELRMELEQAGGFDWLMST